MDPSGRRWKRLRIAATVIGGVLLIVLAVAVPAVTSSPALAGATTPEGPTVAEVGDAPPVIGEGVLVRVVKLLRDGASVYGQDPFDGQVVTELSALEIDRAGDAEYALQWYGYDQAAGRTISLTFDDGPDPVYTPELLDLLAEHDVTATFFVTGEQVAKNPDVMRRIVREGHALGNHSLTHVDVGEATPFRSGLELVLSDRIMRAQTGWYASFFRMPYESFASSSMQADVRGILRAQQLGYVVTSHDFDPKDWAYASGELTGDIPMPPLGVQDHVTLLLHDAGGGDRSRTLEYVEELIPLARDAGYTFTTMPQVHPQLAERTGPAEVTGWDRATLALAQLVFVVPPVLLQGLLVLALVTMGGLGVLYTVLALLRARRSPRRTATEPLPASVLVAAYNEELVIRRTLQHVLASAHAVAEIVVVDDGSTDGTAAVVRDMAASEPRIRLLQQVNRGKWAALNLGFEQARQPVVVTLDADTLITPETIGALLARFHSPRVGAVAGVIKVGNRSRNVLTRWQALEYVTQIGVERAAAAYLDAIAIVPGACAAWRRTAVLEAGGYSEATLAEDCDLTLTLHQHGWQIEQAEDAVAYTEAPETADALVRQRVRWMFGTLQAVWRHRSMILRPRYGWLGMLVLPMSALAVLVPLLFTPFVTVVLLLMVVSGGLVPVLGYFALFSIFYGLLAVVAVRLLDERAAHLLMVPLYRVIFEPLRAYLIYSCLGSALRGVRLGWNKLARTAHMDATPAEPLPAPAVPTVAARQPVSRPTAVPA
ncbi:bifunctional polysaccharide deacetylase/glycosyltransferase family 2 protein [Blastococcus capsensis]|uniref:bifunctional polysaccharide deacetylase/glycosyltransferase family 2 protein n=1 Tax=Blastococcus capsensis TaxID=1564163 RepID=UPI0025420CEE|nr:bifunctional polysaccharide deacetylase/glycosyltransferase family 2 protein [Blastococcus capsensis]MDK3257084.1 bifunctional polysaccharide deacetylase/glycosyltransferase family 2 protein [Blastococcus capsensis]